MEYLDELIDRTWRIAWSVAPLAVVVASMARRGRWRPAVIHAAVVAATCAFLVPLALPVRRHVFELPGAVADTAWHRFAELPVPWWVVALPAALLLARLLARSIAFRRRLAVCAPASEDVADRVGALAREIGLRRPPRVLWAPAGETVFVVWGAFGHRLFLPRDAWPGWSEDQRESILLHELAHLRRRDGLTELATTLATVVYWWNPLVWWLRARSRDAAEHSCDRWATRLRDEAREDYARALLGMAEGRVASGAVGASTARAEKRRIAGRLEGILADRRRPGSRPLATAAVLLILAVGTALTAGQAGALEIRHVFDSPADVAAFLRAEPDPGVRRSAVDAIGDRGPRGDGWAASVLVERFAVEESDSVRYEILDALDRLDAPLAVAAIAQEAGEDPSPRVRRRAAEALARQQERRAGRLEAIQWHREQPGEGGTSSRPQ